MQNCPNCGSYLEQELKDGCIYCSKCSQVVNSSLFNKLLSAAWQTRKERIPFEQMKIRLKLDNDFCVLIDSFINEWDYSHDDFYKLLDKLGVSKKF